jgi:hypothetical protein
MCWVGEVQPIKEHCLCGSWYPYAVRNLEMMLVFDVGVEIMEIDYGISRGLGFQW